MPSIRRARVGPAVSDSPWGRSHWSQREACTNRRGGRRHAARFGGAGAGLERLSGASIHLVAARRRRGLQLSRERRAYRCRLHDVSLGVPELPRHDLLVLPLPRPGHEALLDGAHAHAHAQRHAYARCDADRDADGDSRPDRRSVQPASVISTAASTRPTRSPSHTAPIRTLAQPRSASAATREAPGSPIPAPARITAARRRSSPTAAPVTPHRRSTTARCRAAGVTREPRSTTCARRRAQASRSAAPATR